MSKVKVEVKEDVPTKKWYQSKTLWTGFISVVVGVLTSINGQLESGVPLTVMGVLMTALRVISKSKLE